MGDCENVGVTWNAWRECYFLKLMCLMIFECQDARVACEEMLEER